MIDYYEVFKKRALNKGRTFKERVKYNSQINFERFLISSPDSIEVTVNDKEEKIRVALIENKNGDTLVKRYILSKKEDNLKIGDFLYWEGTVWLLFQKRIDTINAYDKFDAIECKNTLKWIDNYGVLKQIPCYLAAQTDKTIQPNYRTWNDMITPQPNKNLLIITSSRDIVLGTKIIIDDTAWQLVESDYISIDGVIFLSLIEDKIDREDDNLQEEIANFIDLNSYKILVPQENIQLNLENSYKLSGVILHNGNYCSNEVNIKILEGEDNIQLDNDVLVGLNYGLSKIRIEYSEDKNVYKDIEVNIVNVDSPLNETFLLLGDENIKWGRIKEYKCKRFINGIEEDYDCEFEVIDENNLLQKVEKTSNTLIVTANEKNLQGSFTIKCKISNQDLILEKKCNVVSLWM